MDDEQGALAVADKLAGEVSEYESNAEVHAVDIVGVQAKQLAVNEFFSIYYAAFDGKLVITTSREGIAALKEQGIPTAIYYPIPLHCQEPYRQFPVAEGGAPVSERLAEEVISLPMHAYLDEPTQDRVIAAARRALGA